MVATPARARSSLAAVSDTQGYDDRDDEVLPDQTSDDTDRGWGERPDDTDADDERLLREKPPHW